jgi:hypothetical protein
MLRLAAVVAVLLATATLAAACTFCPGEARSRQTLRMHYATAKAVLYGQLKNPRLNPQNNGGQTDLQIAAVLKDDPARGTLALLTLDTYLPVIGSTPPDYIVFCNVANGKLDATFGVPATPAIMDYLKGAAKLDDADPVAKLAYSFKHLDSIDETVAGDAFQEFARAADGDIVKSAKHFEAAKVRRLLSDPKTPAERLGVFAFLLGVSGGPADAAFLLAQLKEHPMTERTSGAYGGLLAGYTLLAPKDGWALAAAVMGDARQSYSARLSAIGTVRFFQASRGVECKAEVLRCCAALLPHGDLADQAVEDLRRWGYWDLTSEVLAQFPKQSHSAPIVRRSIVRYALCCPDDASKKFIAELRRTDLKLVQSVEELLKLYEPVPKK